MTLYWAPVGTEPDQPGWTDLGYIEGDGLQFEYDESQNVSNAWEYSLKARSSTMTFTFTRGMPARLFRLLTGHRHPRISRMHREYARRLRARRQRN